MNRILKLREKLKRVKDPISFLEGFFALSPVGFQVFSPEGNSVLANQAFQDLFGLEPPPTYNVRKSDYLRQRGLQALIESAFGGETVRLPVQWYDPAAETETPLGTERKFAVETYIFPILDEQSQIRHVIFTYRDVTREQEYLDRLSESLFFLEEAQKVGKIGSWISDVDDSGKLVWSTQTYRMFGVEEGTPVSVGDFFRLLHPEDLEAVRAASQNALVNGAPYSIEHRIVLPDGKVRWIREQAEVIRNQKGEAVRMLGVSQDITELRALEQEMRQAQKMEAMGRFAGGIAHDFNNVLGVILLHAEYAIEELGDSPVAAEIRAIKESAERAARLTRQILAFSRKQVFEDVVFDVNLVVRDLEKMLTRMMGEDVRLRLALSNAPVLVQADRGQVEQILMNLLVNARDAMAKGGEVTIRTAIRALEAAEIHASGLALDPGDFIELVVEDSGTGMSEEIRGQIFEPFFTTKEKGKGTGLGLSTVYGIVRQANGDVTVRSAIGRGSSFLVYLPLSRAPISHVAEAKPIVGDLRAQGETVLLIEDEEALRDVTASLLRDKGYEVIEAADGLQALDVFRESGEKISLVITDVIMPEITGPELVQKILAEDAGSKRPLKVLFLSGYSAGELTRHGVDQESTYFLEKPFSGPKFLGKVREILGHQSDKGSSKP